MSELRKVSVTIEIEMDVDTKWYDTDNWNDVLHQLECELEHNGDIMIDGEIIPTAFIQRVNATLK